MPLKTPAEYIASLRDLHLNAYIFGKKVENTVDDPILHPSLNAIAMTYELALDPKYEDVNDCHFPPYGAHD